MTPIYRSPDRDQTQSMQALLQEHRIETSIIETKKSNNTSDSSTVIWYELWLRNINELARAKTIITQHEFTTYRTSMTSYRTSVVEQKKRSESVDQAIQANTVKTTNTVSVQEKPIDEKALIPSPIVAKPSIANPFLAKPATDSTLTPKQSSSGQLREDLIPINNKRVFKRLGLLLGFSEEEIQKWNNNKLYRPWDAAELNESVKKLKQKCS